ncbi:hypothetical protein, partial [Limosilactobacillus panis]
QYVSLLTAYNGLAAMIIHKYWAKTNLVQSISTLNQVCFLFALLELSAEFVYSISFNADRCINSNFTALV